MVANAKEMVERSVTSTLVESFVMYFAELHGIEKEEAIRLSMRQLVHGPNGTVETAAENLEPGCLRKVSLMENTGYSLVQLMRSNDGYKLREDMSNFLPKKMTKDEEWKKAWFHQGSKEKRDMFYVSFAWDLPIGQTMEILEAFNAGGEHLFWIDAFAVNQHKADQTITDEGISQEHLHEHIKLTEEVMRLCNGVLLMFHPLNEPLSLSRLWVWYEIHVAGKIPTPVHLGTTKSGSRALEEEIMQLDVLKVENMPKDEQTKAIMSSLTTFDSLLNLSIEKARLSFEDDRAALLKQMQGSSVSVSKLLRRDLAKSLLEKARSLANTAHTGQFGPLIRKLMTYFDDDQIYLASLRLDLANALRILGGSSDNLEQVAKALVALEAQKTNDDLNVDTKLECLVLLLHGIILRTEIKSREARLYRSETVKLFGNLRNESNELIHQANEILNSISEMRKNPIAMEIALQVAQAKYWQGRLFYLLHSAKPGVILDEYEEDREVANKLLDESVELFDKLDGEHRHFNRGAALAVKGGIIGIQKDSTYEQYSNPYLQAFEFWKEYFPDDGEVVNYKYSHVYWILQHGDYRRALSMLDGHGGDLRKFALAGNVQKLKYLDWGLSKLQCLKQLSLPKAEIKKHVMDLCAYLEDLKTAGAVHFGPGGFNDRCKRISIELSDVSNAEDLTKTWKDKVLEVEDALRN